MESLSCKSKFDLRHFSPSSKPFQPASHLQQPRLPIHQIRRNAVITPHSSFRARRFTVRSQNRSYDEKFTTVGAPISCQDGSWIRMIGRGVFGFAAAAAAVFSVCCDSPCLAESLTVAFPASRATEVNTVQRTLVEAWGLIRETFIDPTFNHQGFRIFLP
ncbi:hypothetical protein ACLOJK_015021 [Asimina triloba]